MGVGVRMPLGVTIVGILATVIVAD